jgi:hypothetical protein
VNTLALAADRKSAATLRGGRFCVFIGGFSLFGRLYTHRDRHLSVKKKEAEQMKKTLSALMGSAMVFILPVAAQAAPADLSNKVATASQPIKDLLLGVADPVCYIVFAWGLLECMLGKGESGVKRMKFAALGFIGLNWLPFIMDILRGVR